MKSHCIQLWLKLVYSAFFAVMIPTYWHEYGPTNFLYFCDIAVFVTLAALWLENALLASIAAVGIVLPQMVWVLDFSLHFFGLQFIGMSDYMFNAKHPFFTRILSLFHGWLPLLLLYLVWRLGYDRRAIRIWTGLAWFLLLVCFFWMPPPGTAHLNNGQPVNINYVFGFGDKTPQSWMPPSAWLVTMLVGLPVLIWLPTHFAFLRLFKARSAVSS